MTLFATIASKSELPFVRALQISLKRHHPDAPLHLLLLDEPEECFDPSIEPFTLWKLSALDSLPRWRVCAFICERDALRDLLIPVFLDELVAAGEGERLVYLDVRSQLYAPLTGLLAALENHKILVTPRLSKPFHGVTHPNHSDWLQAGAASTALLALTGDVDNRYALRQWREWTFAFHHLEHSASYTPFNPERVLYLWERAHLFREPGCGLSPWNFHEWEPEKGTTLSLVHFLPTDPGAAPAFLHPLQREYSELLNQQGLTKTSAWRYTWDYFDNGIRIPSLGRALYRQSATMARRWERPFSADSRDSLLLHLAEEVGPSGTAMSGGLARIWWETWRQTLALTQRFPDPFVAQRSAFVDWLTTGKSLGGVDPTAYDPAFLPSRSLPVGSALQQDQLRRRGATLKATAHQLVRKTGGTVLRTLLPREKLDKLYFSYIERSTQSQASSGLAALLPQRPSQERSASVTPEALGINVAGYLTGDFGLAEAGRGIARAVQAGGLPHTLRNYILPSHRWSDRSLSGFTEDNPYPVNLLMVNGPELPLVRTEFGDAWFRGKYNVGLWYWETPRLPDDWFPALKVLDEVWATSQFVADAITRSSGARVTRILHPIQIDESRVRPNRAAFGLPEETFLFLFSFDFYSYIERKNPLGVVAAFAEAFGGRTDVGLVIKCLNSARHPEKAQALNAALKGLNAYFVDQCLEREAMYSLIASCNSYVSLHRTEGLGLGMAEAMYLGKPVIGTGYSGNMDFMNETNSLPTRYKLIELERDYGTYLKGNIWADPDTTHAAECMARLVSDATLTARLGAQARADLHTHFSPQAAGHRIEERLREIQRERG